jgi:hypothetical protein
VSFNRERAHGGMQFHRTMTGALAFGMLAVTPFAASAQTTPANPPQQGTPSQPGSPAQPGSPSQPVPSAPAASTDTQVTTKADIGQLASALSNIDVQTTTVKSMSNVPLASIQLVNATEIAKGKNAAALTDVVAKKDAQIQSLRGALSGVSVTDTANGNQNMTFATALSNLSAAQKLPAPVTLNRVIALNSSPSGSVTVFYK